MSGSTYLTLLYIDLQEEAAKKQPNYAAMARKHYGNLTRIVESGGENASLANDLRRELLLAQTIPMTHFGIDDRVDSYTGEPISKLCSIECDNLMGDQETYFCMAGVSCTLNEPCPWEMEPGVPQVKLAWLNLPMPQMVYGISTTDIEEDWWRSLEQSTAALTAEDDNYEFYHSHWTQQFDEWDDLTEFREEHNEQYDALYQAMSGEEPPWEKFDDIVPLLESILDAAVLGFLEGTLSEATISVIFHRLNNGITLDYQGIGEQAKKAKDLREKYRQWIIMAEDHAHMMPDGDPALDMGEEDDRHVQALCDWMEEQEAKAYGSEWVVEKAYREAACKGGPADARAAARKARGSWLEELEERA